uniref:beta strand repeat-containing protein n=1 Tax=Flavobacterium sp. TaxID=239 RepID=UPI0037C034E0
MINIYDSVVACTSAGTPHSQKQGTTSYTATKRNWLSFVTVFVTLFCFTIVQGQSTLISPTGDGGFEFGTTLTDNGWTAVNSATNAWNVGTATSSGGTKSAYISNTSGSTYAYSNSTTAVSHFYRDITVPASESVISLSFKLKGDGDVFSGTYYDKLMVYTAPTTFTPATSAPASPGTALTGATLAYVQPANYGAAYNVVNVVLPSSLAGTTFRLIFTWHNDNSAGTVPSSVDEISLISRSPITPDAAPINFTPTAVTQTGMTVNWLDNSTNETSFRVYRSTDNVTFSQVGTDIVSTSSGTTGTAYNLPVASGLIPGVTYYYRIVAFADLETSYLTGSQATNPPGTITSIASGNWSQTSTWSSGAIPTATDNVIIADGHTVNIDLVAPTCLDLTVGQGASGVLTFTSTSAATLSVNGSITVGAGGIFNAGSATSIVHNIFLGGVTATSPYASNLIVDGSFDMWLNATTGRATLTFFGILNSTISGSGTIDLNNTNIINKGATTATALVTPPVLDVQKAFTVQAASTLGFVATHTAGTIKISGTFTQSNPIFTIVGYTIPATGGIWLSNPNFTIAGLTGSPSVNGLFRVTAGTYNIGTSSGNSVGSGTNSVYKIEGGAINVAGRFNLTSTGVYYNQSDGTISVANVGNTTVASASFGITSTSASFIMSGGTIVLVQRNGGTLGSTTRDYYNVGTPTITGGTLQVGTAATATNFNFRLYGYAPNININNTTNNKIVQVHQSTGVLYVFGTLTVNPGTTFDCLGMTAFALGNVVNNGIIQGLVSGSRFDFSGTTPQTYSGTGTFGTSSAPFIGTGVGIANYTNVTLSAPIVTTRTNLFGGSFINS